jgi:hypothetical protein
MGKFKDRRVPKAIVAKRAKQAKRDLREWEMVMWNNYAAVMPKDVPDSYGYWGNPKVIKALDKAKAKTSKELGVTERELAFEMQDSSWMEYFGDEALRGLRTQQNRPDEGGDTGIMTRDGKRGKDDPRVVGNTPEGIDLYGFDHGEIMSDDPAPKGYVDAGYLDTGTNAAGGRISTRVFVKKADKKAADADHKAAFGENRSYTQQYHDETMRQGKSRRNADGTGTSVLSVTAYNPADGKWYNVPGFNRETGQDYANDDEALQKALPDIKAGRVKAYDTAEQGISAAQEEHKELENPQAGLLQDLFNKSGDELKKIEEGEGAPKSPAEQGQPPLLEEESEEDKRIRERIKMFQEGKDPDAKKMAGAGMLQDSEFDDLATDPVLQPLVGEDDASPEEERQLATVVNGASQFIFGDKMSAVIQNLKKGGHDSLYEPVSFAVYQILAQQKQELEKRGDKASPAVFFAETGAIPLVTDMVWDLAKQLKLPGADDQNQYAASVINVMKMAGEHTLESGDQAAIDEATKVASNMVQAGMGGEQSPMPPTKNPLAQGIDQALLGGAV